MKITVIGPVYPYRGGIAHFTSMLVKTFKAASHEINVISFKRQYPSWLYPGKTDKDSSQIKFEVPSKFLLDPFYPWTWINTARDLVEVAPNLVIIMWWTTFWALPYAFLTHTLHKKGIKVVYLIHNVMPHESRFWDRFLARLALCRASNFIVQTEKEAKRLHSLLPDATPAVIPHPIYSMFNEGNLTKEAARKKLNFSLSAQVLLFFGIVRPYKGLSYLFQALSLLRKKGVLLHLVIAGEFWELESEYRALAEELGIHDSIHFYNRYIPNEEVPIFFKSSDLFVAPYIDGTQSGAVKLAIGFGLPVVLTKCIVDDMLVKYPNIWQAEERDPKSLAFSIERALAEPVSTSPQISLEDWLRVVHTVEKM